MEELQTQQTSLRLLDDSQTMSYKEIMDEEIVLFDPDGNPLECFR
jgi:hypothetical protein